jgi:hypothetical protein
VLTQTRWRCLPTLRYTLPEKLSGIWDALVGQGLSDISKPIHSMSELAALLLLSANTAADDPRLELCLEHTKSVEL